MQETSQISGIAAEKENVRVFHQWVEAHRAHDLDRMLSYVAEDIKIDSAAFPPAIDKATARAHWGGIYASFPDMRVDPVTVTAEGDRITAEMDFGGTMEGGMRDKPPTGKRFKTRGAFVLEFTGGKIREIRTYYDSRVMMSQLGLLGK